MLREHASGVEASEVGSTCHTSGALRARGEVANERSERSGDPADVASERRGATQTSGELEAEAREEESPHQRKLREQALTSIGAETRETDTETERQRERAEEVQRRLREQALKSMLLRRKQQAAAAAAAAAGGAAGGVLPL
jgi:hypothetical protein